MGKFCINIFSRRFLWASFPIFSHIVKSKQKASKACKTLTLIIQMRFNISNIFFLHPTHVVHWKNAFYRDSVSWDARLEAQERESLNARENSVVNHMACIRCKRKMLQKSTLPIPSCTRSRRTDRTMGIGLIAWFEIFFHIPSSPPSSPKKLPELSYRTWDSKWNTPQS